MTTILLLLMAITPVDRLAVAARDAWLPRPRPVRSEWCCENIRIPSETGAQPGPFDLTDHAYLREILDSVDDPDVRKSTFVGATQIGKTELVKAVILSQGEVARAPMMFAGPDIIYVRETRRNVYKQAEGTPALASRVPPARQRNDLWIDLEKCLVYLAWSGSSQRLSGRSCKVVLKSEVDRWQESPSLADERTKAFPDNYTIVEEGTPVEQSPHLWPSYQQSDRRTYHVPCPHCGHWQALRFFPHKSGDFAGKGGVAGLKDDSGNWRTPDQARKHAYYCCEKGCRINEDDKPEMVQGGRWVRDGQRIDEHGKIVGKPANPGRHAGYALNSLYSSTITLGDAAQKWLEVRDNQELLCRFFNDWLGLPFFPRGSTPRWKDLGIRLAGSHPRGSVPKAAYFLTAGADVQSYGVFWSVRAWGDQKTSWLVDWGFCPKKLHGETADEELASDLAQLDECVLDRRWPVLGENPRGYSALAVRILGIDRGWRPTDVDAFVRAHPGERAIAVFGDPKIHAGTLYRPSKVDRDAKTGRVFPDGVEVWGIDTAAYKSEISDRWQADRRRLGVWWLPENVLTVDGGEDYLRQVTSEHRTLELLHGRKVVRWELIAKGSDNHYWDTEVYQAALADMIVGNEWDASKWHWGTATPQVQVPGQLAAREHSETDFSAR